MTDLKELFNDEPFNDEPFNDEPFNDRTLREAVNFWLGNKDEAEQKYGHISTWNTGQVTNMHGLFRGAFDFDDDIAMWDTSNVTDMSFMFYEARIFNRSIGRWDTSNVTNMSFMFYDARIFDQYIGSWQVGRVQNMRYMFAHALSFDQDIGGWDVSSVINMSAMFLGPPTSELDDALERYHTKLMESDDDVPPPLLMVENTFDVSPIVRHRDILNIAFNTSQRSTESMSFNQYIGPWDVHNVRKFVSMFENAINFDQDLDSWDIGNATDTAYMFFGAIQFNGKLESWNVRNVINMDSMFKYAFAFDQYLGHWSFVKAVDRTLKRNHNCTPESPNFITCTALEKRLNGHSYLDTVAMNSVFSYTRRKDFLMFLVNYGYIPYQGTYSSTVFHKIFSNNDMRQTIMSYI